MNYRLLLTALRNDLLFTFGDFEQSNLTKCCFISEPSNFKLWYINSLGDDSIVDSIVNDYVINISEDKNLVPCEHPAGKQ